MSSVFPATNGFNFVEFVGGGEPAVLEFGNQFQGVLGDGVGGRAGAQFVQIVAVRFGQFVGKDHPLLGGGIEAGDGRQVMKNLREKPKSLGLGGIAASRQVGILR